MDYSTTPFMKKVVQGCAALLVTSFTVALCAIVIGAGVWVAFRING